ncbi:hypothetical protein PMAYCL1PPCAC_25069, partial [Pristionchus mayeri]
PAGTGSSRSRNHARAPTARTGSAKGRGDLNQDTVRYGTSEHNRDPGPKRTHDGLSSLVPQGNVLVGVLTGQSVERPEGGLDHLSRGPWVAGTEVGPFVEEREW